MAEVGHNPMAGQQTKDANAVVLALLRIAVGIFFVFFGQYKVFGSGFVLSGFRNHVQGFIRDGAYPFMVPVLQWIQATVLSLVSPAEPHVKVQPRSRKCSYRRTATQENLLSGRVESHGARTFWCSSQSGQ